MSKTSDAAIDAMNQGESQGVKIEPPRSRERTIPRRIDISSTVCTPAVPMFVIEVCDCRNSENDPPNFSVEFYPVVAIESRIQERWNLRTWSDDPVGYHGLRTPEELESRGFRFAGRDCIQGAIIVYSELDEPVSTIDREFWGMSNGRYRMVTVFITPEAGDRLEEICKKQIDEMKEEFGYVAHNLPDSDQPTSI